MITIIIDGAQISAREDTTVLSAALESGFYIPHLCSHPDLPPVLGSAPAEFVYRGESRIENQRPELKYEGCGLCVVQVEGTDEFRRACITPLENGMTITSVSPELEHYRQERLMFLHAKHPHSCLVCAQKEGCARFPCSMDRTEEERCCARFGKCEFQKLSEYIKLKPETPRYVFQNLPDFKQDPLFNRNYNLCIGCTRCVRVCRDVRGVEAIDFVFDQEGRVIVGTVNPSLKDTGCQFCLSCVEVCPTGALMEKTDLRFHQSKPVLPPRKRLWVEMSLEQIEAVPEKEGVYQLLDENEKVIYIKGAMNLRQELREQQELNEKARFFMFEAEEMYGKRESELLQQFMTEHGDMPEGNREIDDLF